VKREADGRERFFENGAALFSWPPINTVDPFTMTVKNSIKLVSLIDKWG
jgi:hypothetical protein